MTAPEYFTVIGFLTVLEIIGAGLDLLLTPRIKAPVARVLECFFSFADHRPISWRFYLSSVFGSTVVLLLVVASSGGIEALQRTNNPFSLAFQSTAQLILAICFKTLVFDYLMAMKSSVLTKLIREKSASKRGAAVAIDFFGTSILTGFVIAWLVAIQSHSMESIPQGSISKWISSLAAC